MGLFGKKKRDPFKFEIPDWTMDESGAVSQPTEPPANDEKPSFWDRLDTASQRLAMAQAKFDGDFNTAASRADRAQEQQALGQRAAAERQQRAQVANALRAQGMTPEQVTMAMNGMGQFIPKAPEPTAMENNIAAWQRMTPEQRAAYAQMQEAQSGPVTLTLPGNRVYSGPRSGLAEAMGGMPAGVPAAPVGKLTPISPTIQNTPAPQTGANGLPSVLSPDQYQATVAAMGKERTDEWMRRNNIRIGGR